MPFHFNYDLGPTVSVRREALVVAEALGQNMGLLVSLLPYHLLVIFVRSYPKHACLVLGGGNWDRTSAVELGYVCREGTVPVVVPEKAIHFATPLLSYHLSVMFGQHYPNQTCQTALSLFVRAPYAESLALTPLDRAVYVVAWARDLNVVLVASLLP